MNHKDVIEYFLAGASACQIGTANFINYSAINDIASDLEKYCTEKNILNISELTGKVILNG